jgi:hypothetical protein
MHMRDLLAMLAKSLNPLIDELPLVYELAYWPSTPETEVRVSAPKVDASTPQGNAQAATLYRDVQALSLLTVVRLNYVLDLHGLPRLLVLDAELPGDVADRLRSIRSALEQLATSDRLRADAPMREHVMSNDDNTPGITEAIDRMTRAHARLLPRASASEVEAMRATPCANCGEQPTIKGRKRCARCHSYFSKHGIERPSEIASNA